MATIVTFHAHPDDEAIATGGTMARAADEGHRVVLVVATRGENGEVPEGFLRPGEPLWERRVEETMAAAQILGVARVEFLDYVDSGMAGTPTNDDPRCFLRADADEAAKRLARILTEEAADVLTTYALDTGYDHPDHIQVHHVGLRAAELAGTARVYESTFDRDEGRKLFAEAVAAGIEVPDVDVDIDSAGFGSPSERITTRVDVSAYLDRKRAAMAAHASQISDTSFFLAMAPDLFARVWGTEYYIRRGAPPGTHEAWLLDGP